MTVASTPALESDRQSLIALIGDEAVFHGDFTLSSGKKATYYVDMRKLTLDHRAAPAIGRLVLAPTDSTTRRTSTSASTGRGCSWSRPVSMRATSSSASNIVPSASSPSSPGWRP